MKRILVILLMGCAGIYSAQSKLTLNNCIELALENNHDHKQIILDREKAEEQVREAYGSSLFPSIDGDVTYSRAVKRPRFIIETPFFSGSFPAGSKNTLTASVNAEQPLFTGAMFLAVNIAETFADISKKAEEYSEIELVTNVKEAYYTLLLADNLIELAEVQLERAEKNLKDAKSMYDAGLIAEYDYIKANVEYQNSIPALTETKNQFVLAENNLKLIIGKELDEKISLEGELSYSKTSGAEYDNSEQVVLSKNKMIQQMALDVEMKDLVKSYQFTEHLPKINAFANWQTQAQEDNRAFNDWRYINSLSIGLTLKVPIFKGFTLDSKVEQAEIDYKRSREGLAGVKKAVLNQYENTVRSINKTEEQIEAYKLAKDEATKAYNMATKRFNSGLGTQLEVSDALVGLTSAEVNLLQSIHQHYVYNANLDLILGKNINELKN